MPPLACEPQTDNLCFSQSNALNWRPFLDDLGQTERLHAAGTASAVLLRIILTEREREIAGPGWCVCRWLREVVSERWKPALHWDRLPKNQPAEITMFQISEVQESPAFNGRRSFLTLRGFSL